MMSLSRVFSTSQGVSVSSALFSFSSSSSSCGSSLSLSLLPRSSSHFFSTSASDSNKSSSLSSPSPSPSSSPSTSSLCPSPPSYVGGSPLFTREPVRAYESSNVAPNPNPLSVTTFSPSSFQHRHCRIYRPARSATQQGTENQWKIEFDTVNKWLNPLMGWTSSRDTAHQLREYLYFPSLQSAVDNAQAMGWSYTVLPYHHKALKAKSYSDNFKYRPNKKV